MEAGNMQGEGVHCSSRVVVRSEVQDQIQVCLQRSLRARAQESLLMVDFQNLFEYLQVIGLIGSHAHTHTHAHTDRHTHTHTCRV